MNAGRMVSEMAEASDIQGQITECLRDAGCTDEMIIDFMVSQHKGDTVAGHRLLSSHRKTLLDDLHVCQKRIDCLDFLMYKLKL